MTAVLPLSGPEGKAPTTVNDVVDVDGVHQERNYVLYHVTPIMLIL